LHLGAAAPHDRRIVWQLEPKTIGAVFAILTVACFVWMAALGVSLLRSRPRREELAPASVA
jgi:hypothetical protein